MEAQHNRGGARPGAGRPRRQATLAAALRDAFPVERLVALAERAVEAGSDDVRLRALLAIYDRAHGKVTERHEVIASRGDDERDDDTIDLSTLTIEQKAEWIELEERRAALLASADEQPRTLLALPPTSVSPVGVSTTNR